MNNKKAFDIKMFAGLRIHAASEAEARADLAKYLDCATVNFGADKDGDPITGEASIDGEADLFEIDGETAFSDDDLDDDEEPT